ncbi:MAG: NRDE family protein [Burkholderiales bacterium]
MCLIVLAWRVHPELALVVAANRDEFHARPAAPAAFWDDHPEILAGRDLEAGGTWMGVSRAGRFAAVTNFRGACEPRAAESRGALVSRFLSNRTGPGEYIHNLKPDLYSGFSLLAADGEELWWTSNRGGEPRRLTPGIYGLGNALLDAPEVEAAKKDLAGAIEAAPGVEPLFSVLEKARIVNPQYGTRCSTAFLKGKRIRYAERAFGPDGAAGDTLHYDL